MAGKKVSQNVLKSIKTKGIKPKPKWEFLLKNWIFWILGILTIILGAVSLGITVFLLTATKWELRHELDSSLFSFTLDALPYFWIVLLILMTIVAHYNIRHTRKGYKLKTSHLTAGIILISLISGLVFFSTGTAKQIEEQMQRRMPPYKKIHQMKIKRMERKIEKFQELNPGMELPPRLKNPPIRPPKTR